MPARRQWAFRCCILLVVLWGARGVSGQITSAAISGTVRDQTGASMPGVDVSVKNVETGLTRSAVTAADGAYRIPGLPPGMYAAHATLQGFVTAIEAAVPVSVAEDAVLHLTMRVGVSESVNVVGTLALVDIKMSTLSALVDEQTIANLPLNGRNFIDLTLLQPGVAAFTTRQRNTVTSRGQQINVNGAAGRANSYLLDGANMNGYAGLAVPTAGDTSLGVDMIREFRVVTNAFPADYGRAMGGVVSVVTKSGTNENHGSGFEFFRNKALDTRNVFDTEKPDFERHQFGLTFGGPMRRNSTFLFAGAEWLVEDFGLTQLTEVPSLAARSGALGPIADVARPYLDLFPLPNGPDLGDGLARYTFGFNRPTRETFAQARVDHNVSSTSAMFVRYTVDDASRELPTSLPQFWSEQRSRNQWLTVEDKRTVRAAVLNTARFSYSRVQLRAQPANENAASALTFIPGETMFGNILLVSREYGPDRMSPQVQNIQFFTFSDDIAYSTGRHLVKIGVLAERAHSDAESRTNVRGRYTFPTVARFLAGAPSRFIGVVPGYQLARARRSTMFGFYLQDDVVVRTRLTLNLGVRYEFYTVPNDINERDSTLRNIASDREFTVGDIFRNPSLKNLGPRIGFAWDVGGDGKTAVRGGGGVYYDTEGPFNSALIGAAFAPPFASSVNQANPAFPHPSFDAIERSARALDYNVRQPRMFTTNFTLQREVAAIVLTAGYAGSRGYNLVQAVEGNPAVPQVLADGTLFFPVNAPRRNPNWDSIDYRTTGGRSWYNALQLVATRRFRRAHRWQVSYTLATATDETQGQVGGDATNSSVFPQNPIDPSVDRGPADFDVRHVLAMNGSWAIARGWQVNALALLRSGVPFSPALQTQSNWSRSGNTPPGSENRPNVRAGRSREDIILGGTARYFDPGAFVLQPGGFLGNAGRNMLTGPGLVNVDLSLVKSVGWRALGDGGQIEVRAEMFNAFNRANLGLPNRVVFAGASENEAPLATAGLITTTATDARQIQLGVKVKF